MTDKLPSNAAQMASPSFRLPALDHDFLLGESTRGVRFLLEYQKAEECLRRWGVEFSPESQDQTVRDAQEGEAGYSNAQLEAMIAEAMRLRCMRFDVFFMIGLPAQTLELHDDDGTLLSRYPVSTARNGPGELNGSYCTPRGRHLIRAKIGAGQPANTVFVRRRPTGECWTPELAEKFPNRDWMLTRILWLSGLEPGFNRLGNVDTMRRYIYLHGCPDTVAMGTPRAGWVCGSGYGRRAPYPRHS